jgi:hypothetical protein
MHWQNISTMGAMTSGKNKALFNVAKSVKRLEEKNNKSNPTVSEDLPQEPPSKVVPKEPPPSYAAEDKALFTVVSSFKRIGEKEDLPVVSEIKEEVVDDNKIVEEKEELPAEPPSSDNSDLINELINIVIDFKEEIDDNIRQTRQNLGADIAFIEQRQNLHKETYRIDVVSQIKEEVLEEVLVDVQNILSGDVANNIKRLEEKIDIIRDGYKQTLNEGLLNIPPDVKNSDPLTPLDQNFVTLKQLNDHYKLFLNRIQTQIATLGGGGSVELQYLEDLNVGIATNITAYDGYYLQVDVNQTGDDANKKFKFAPLSITGVTTFSSTVTFEDDVVFTGANSNARWDESKSDLVLYNDTRLTLGSNEDFQMWHGGTHTFIKNTGGDLRIRGDVIKLAREDSSERYIECNVNSSVDLYFNGDQKFATTVDGISVTGLVTTTNLYATGVVTATTFVGDVTGNVTGTATGLSGAPDVDLGNISASAGDLTITNITTLNDGGLTVAGVTTHNGDVKFPGAAYNIQWDQATSKFKFDDSAQCVWGSASGGDLRIWHASDVSNIKNDTGQLRIAGNDIRLQTQNNSADYLLAVDGGSVSIFYDDVKRFETSGIGATVSGQLDSTTLNVTGVSTFGDSLDVEGQLYVESNIRHIGDTDTYIEFTDDQIRLIAGGKPLIHAEEATIDTVIINDGSNDLDFRVEGQNDEYQIFSDGSADKVGIGSSAPGAKLDVGGTLNVSGIGTFRNGVNLLGLLHTNDDVNFTGDAYNLSWDKSTNSLEFTDNAKATFGAGNDLEIHSDGTTGVVGGAVSFTSDITVGTSQAQGVVLTSPNGTKYRLVVADDGTLSTSSV